MVEAVPCYIGASFNSAIRPQPLSSSSKSFSHFLSGSCERMDFYFKAVCAALKESGREFFPCISLAIGCLLSSLSLFPLWYRRPLMLTIEGNRSSWNRDKDENVNSR